MDLLIRGIAVGLILSVMTGPIFFALIQASLERGVVGGLLVSSGVWFSDLMFILLLFTSFSLIEHVLELPHFTLYAGILGSVILVSFGLGMLLNNDYKLALSMRYRPGESRKGFHPILWLKGFLLNTVNPFTVFFWIGIFSMSLGYDEFSFKTVGLFFIGLMGTVMLCDVLKIVLAERIRRRLHFRVILKIRKLTGLALIGFGIAVLVRIFV